MPVALTPLTKSGVGALMIAGAGDVAFLRRGKLLPFMLALSMVSKNPKIY